MCSICNTLRLLSQRFWELEAAFLQPLGRARIAEHGRLTGQAASLFAAVLRDERCAQVDLMNETPSCRLWFMEHWCTPRKSLSSTEVGKTGMMISILLGHLKDPRRLTSKFSDFKAWLFSQWTPNQFQPQVPTLLRIWTWKITSLNFIFSCVWKAFDPFACLKKFTGVIVHRFNSSTGGSLSSRSSSLQKSRSLD